MLKSFICSLFLLCLLKQSNQALVNIPMDAEDLEATDDLRVLEDDPGDLAYPGFVKFGKYSGTNEAGQVYDKFFWFPSHYRATWAQAKFTCKNFGLKFMSLDSQAEADYFFPLFVQKSALFDDVTHIGAVTTVAKSKTEWFWVESGMKAKVDLKWGAGQPDNYGTQECLGILKTPGSYEIHDVNCFETYSKRFICSSTEYV